MFKGFGFKGLGRQLPLAVMAFAFATVVWLVFYFRFPSAPLSETEFLVAFLLAYLCGLGLRRLIARRKQADAATLAPTEKDPEG